MNRLRDSMRDEMQDEMRDEMQDEMHLFPASALKLARILIISYHHLIPTYAVRPKRTRQKQQAQDARCATSDTLSSPHFNGCCAVAT